MKRREFLWTSVLSLVSVSAFISDCLADVLWVKPGGSVQYKEVAPPGKAGKKCVDCKYFKDDKKVKDGGLCTLKAVTKVPAYVKKEGNCTMWQKKA